MTEYNYPNSVFEAHVYHDAPTKYGIGIIFNKNSRILFDIVARGIEFAGPDFKGQNTLSCLLMILEFVNTRLDQIEKEKLIKHASNYGMAKAPDNKDHTIWTPMSGVKKF